MTHTRTHVYVRFANPYLVCAECRQAVDGYHDAKKCGCDGDYYVTPCEHKASISDLCPSWSPVDGCRCEQYGYTHAAPAVETPGG